MQSGAGVPYVSKLEALQEFAARAKMSGLKLQASAPAATPSSQPSDGMHQSSRIPGGTSAAGGTQSSTKVPHDHDRTVRPAQRLVLMDDVPHAHDASQRAALLETISEYAIICILGCCQDVNILCNASYCRRCL